MTGKPPRASEDEVELEYDLTTKTGRLRYSITNLWDKFANTESIGFAIVFNLSLATLGFIVFYFTEGWLSFAAAVFGVFNLYPIVQWVFGL